MYEIVVAEPGEFYGHRAGNWSNQLGDENEFASIAEAEAGIRALQALGDEWADAIYGIRVISERYPELVDV